MFSLYKFVMKRSHEINNDVLTPREVDDLLEQATAAREAGKWHKSQKILERAARLATTLIVPYLLL